MKRILLLLILLTACASQVAYDPNYKLDSHYVLNAAGIKEYPIDLKVYDSWGQADAFLVLARLNKSKEYYEKACAKYLEIRPQSKEEDAILAETLASLNCFGKGESYKTLAINIWKELGVSWRALLLFGKNPEFETSMPEPILNFKGDNLTIGKTKIEITKNDRVITQVDRVYRDWLGEQFQSPYGPKILRVFSERLTYNESELREDIGWHEGARLTDVINAVNPTYFTAVGTLVAKKGDKWYASDENGIFRFEVPLDKVSYPTTRFLREDVAMIVDSHGVNMLVEQAIRNKATVVLSDCDHVAKVKAAIYLSEKGISTICFPDRFVYDALGHDAKLVGSPVWRVENNTMIFGDSPIMLQKNEKIVVTNADIGKRYAIWYYQTPTQYFEQVAKEFPLDIKTATIDDFGQTERVYDLARKEDAHVVATRVFNSYDYGQANKWLDENVNNSIILFHSMSYPYGVILMKEYPGRLSFDDPNLN